MAELTQIRTVPEYFGENVFNLKTMRNYLSAKAYKSLSETIKNNGKLDPTIADEVADAMKTWAVSKGATHYTHWFQPLTGTTAEKHDSFIQPDGEGGVLLTFSGEELIQGEPDASSFPSGGLRPTFEARGYTGWDPTSPAFIKEGPQGATLCIPTYFVGWKGEALDKKTPLLRSMKALSKQVGRLADLLGIKAKQNAYATLGGEQEYFLIDRDFYYQRIDLVQTGRTLFGKEPAKHQQMADHYFGAIKSRVIAFMEDLDREMWKLGAPIKTRHNEVSPGQFEIAPIFENQNLGVDHNMLCMEVMQKVAEKHGLACLLHEKPFKGVNGSGKHNNWSVTGPDGKNWLSPGENPHENERFLVMVAAIIKAVDNYSDLLRAGIASAGNDHRLGSHEAPPAIVSIYLGEQLTDIFEQIEKGSATKSSKQGGTLEVGVDSLPPLPRHASDRNRTSPFAFTGSKFEFRAVGSAHSLAGPNIIINTIVADAISDICEELEDAKKGKKDINKTAQKIVQEIIKKHKRIIFNGDNYTEDWVKEAKKRGLPNMKTTPEALEVMKDKRIAELFERHKVLSKKELDSRYGVYTETYETIVRYEGALAADMVKTLIVPAALEYTANLAETIKSIESINKTKATAVRNILKDVASNMEKAADETTKLETALKGASTDKIRKIMADLREAVDALEGLVPAEIWPLPSYAEMLFIS
ncbi:MAG: glutamine synthetase III [Candidatus Omnitrophica bacterium]|nr:glutamine synthetase III [Candidatus Omnitrophota bacterium]